MFAAETCARKKPDPRPENRVGDFFSVSFTCAGQNHVQALEPHQETSTTDTTTVSGVVYWLSKDPIGISGGLNLYVFCGNNPVNFTDPFGLCSPATWGKPGDEPYVMGLQDRGGLLGDQGWLFNAIEHLPLMHEISQRHDRMIDALNIGDPGGLDFAIVNVPTMPIAAVEAAAAWLVI